MPDKMPTRCRIHAFVAPLRIRRAQPRYSGSIRMFDSKARLDALNFASIDEMIRAYADEAVLLARSQHRVLLDYTPASVDALERLLDSQAAVDLDFQSRLWGSYFGEVL